MRFSLEVLVVKVKICGITNREDAIFCSQAGAHVLGFIFWPGSPRAVTLKKAKDIIKNLDPYILRAGVFVNETKEVVEEIAQSLGLDILQFHGRETAQYCRSFTHNYRVIKVFFPQEGKIPSLSAYRDVDAYLFDIPWQEKQGGKRTLEKNVLAALSKYKDQRIILSGGLTPGNVKECLLKVPAYAVDVASGVEAFPGKKDPQLVCEFIREVTQYSLRGGFVSFNER